MGIIIEFIIAAVIIIFGMVKIIKIIKKNNLLKHKKAIATSVVCIAFAILSLVVNMGFFRKCMLWLYLPVVQPMLFFATNLYAAHHMKEFPVLKKANLIFIITYLAFWILLPDFADDGTLYFLFNLIHGDGLGIIALFLAAIAEIVHIVAFAIQLVKFGRIRKQTEIIAP